MKLARMFALVLVSVGVVLAAGPARADVRLPKAIG